MWDTRCVYMCICTTNTLVCGHICMYAHIVHRQTLKPAAAAEEQPIHRCCLSTRICLQCKQVFACWGNQARPRSAKNKTRAKLQVQRSYTIKSTRLFAGSAGGCILRARAGNPPPAADVFGEPELDLEMAWMLFVCCLFAVCCCLDVLRALQRTQGCAPI
ncbi:hypothetical protein GQ54DRAFT_28930 [Martensiomyces pterosporus]|nr:hypothetical protein GQ54DRAFT_28930 [Martensiomyces pterosporus]